MGRVPVFVCAGTSAAWFAGWGDRVLGGGHVLGVVCRLDLVRKAGDVFFV